MARFHRRAAATTVEYALVLTLVALVCVGTILYLGRVTNLAFWRTGDAIAPVAQVGAAPAADDGGSGAPPKPPKPSPASKSAGAPNADDDPFNNGNGNGG